MNENFNRVQSSLSADLYTFVIDHISAIENALQDYTFGLTNDERMALPKINVDNKAFVEDAYRQMSGLTASKILPTFLVPADLKRDLEMFDQMEAISARLGKLFSITDSTRIIAGSEAFSTALTFKKLAEAAAGAGIPGADAMVERLRERFRGQGSQPANKPETGISDLKSEE